MSAIAQLSDSQLKELDRIKALHGDFPLGEELDHIFKLCLVSIMNDNGTATQVHEVYVMIESLKSLVKIFLDTDD